jgi:hypothetical protein
MTLGGYTLPVNNQQEEEENMKRRGRQRGEN